MSWFTWISDANIGTATNVLAVDAIEDDQQRQSGFQPGTPASAKRVNTALRQSSLVSVALMDALELNTADYDIKTSASALSTAILGTNLFKLKDAFTVSTNNITFNKNLMPDNNKNIGSNSAKVANGYFVNLQSDTITISGKLLLDITHPVWSLFETTDPNLDTPAKVAAYFGGGTWEYFGKGRVTVAYDPDDNDFKTIGHTDGEKAHMLSVDELARHNHGGYTYDGGNHNHSGWTEWAGDHYHNVKTYNYGTGKGTCFQVEPASHDYLLESGVGYMQSSGNHRHPITDSGTHNHQIYDSGNNTAHNNLQPYIVVYRYRRIA